MTLSAGLVCLALTVFNESRGEPIKGQLGVALVTMNRVESGKYPKTLCSVVFQSGQFGWVSTRKSQKAILRFRKQAKRIDEKAWKHSVKIAAKVINDDVRDFTGGALYFNHKKKGRKFRTKIRARVIGNHIFY